MSFVSFRALSLSEEIEDDDSERLPRHSALMFAAVTLPRRRVLILAVPTKVGNRTRSRRFGLRRELVKMPPFQTFNGQRRTRRVAWFLPVRFRARTHGSRIVTRWAAWGPNAYIRPASMTFPVGKGGAFALQAQRPFA